MKKRFSTIAVSSLFIFALSGLSAQATPTVSLNLLDDDIYVGENFEIELWVDGDDIGLDLLTFGFDTNITGSTFSYDGYSVGTGFDDDSAFIPPKFSGSAFPGIMNDDVLLATLSFTATTAGNGNINTMGITDQMFYGLSYELDPITFGWYDINATLDITVNSNSGAPIPEPATCLLFATGCIGLLGIKKRKLSNNST